MAKTNTRPKAVTRTVTHEGAPAYKADVFNELLLTGASTFFGEGTFYESADERSKRFIALVHEATKRDAGRTAKIISDLRTRYKIRTASIVAAVEYQRAGGRNARAVIDSVLQRPDEPAEALAYFMANYGRSLPWALKRGVADAATRLYNERGVIKYGRNDNAAVSMADVIELTHPTPKADWQNALFRYILDEAHNHDGAQRLQGKGYGLKLLEKNIFLMGLPAEDRRPVLDDGYQVLAEAGITWEALSGWLGGPVDAKAWEAVIPEMGVMALIRNLRNFDKAGISSLAQAIVEAKITSAEDVERSRIFPYRAYTAYREAPSDRWKYPLGTTVELAAGNIPSWDRTLFLVDVSGSMTGVLSTRGTVQRLEVAAVMAAAAVKHSTDSDVVLFSTKNKALPPNPGESVLRHARRIASYNGDPTDRRGFGWSSDPLGHGTLGYTAIEEHFDPAKHDRIVIFTDDQMHDSPGPKATACKQIVFFNLAGYAPHSDWGKGRIHIGGFSDAAFSLAADLTDLQR